MEKCLEEILEIVEESWEGAYRGILEETPRLNPGRCSRRILQFLKKLLERILRRTSWGIHKEDSRSSRRIPKETLEGFLEKLPGGIPEGTAWEIPPEQFLEKFSEQLLKEIPEKLPEEFLKET